MHHVIWKIHLVLLKIDHLLSKIGHLLCKIDDLLWKIRIVFLVFPQIPFLELLFCLTEISVHYGLTHLVCLIYQKMYVVY